MYHLYYFWIEVQDNMLFDTTSGENVAESSSSDATNNETCICCSSIGGAILTTLVSSSLFILASKKKTIYYETYITFKVPLFVRNILIILFFIWIREKYVRKKNLQTKISNFQVFMVVIYMDVVVLTMVRKTGKKEKDIFWIQRCFKLSYDVLKNNFLKINYLLYTKKKSQGPIQKKKSRGILQKTRNLTRFREIRPHFFGIWAQKHGNFVKFLEIRALFAEFQCQKPRILIKFSEVGALFCRT